MIVQSDKSWLCQAGFHLVLRSLQPSPGFHHAKELLSSRFVKPLVKILASHVHQSLIEVASRSTAKKIPTLADIISHRESDESGRSRT